MDELLLTRANISAVDQGLPRGQGDQRKGRGLVHRQRGGFGRQVVLADRDEFGERADVFLEILTAARGALAETS
jgi:hypothetical protein